MLGWVLVAVDVALWAASLALLSLPAVWLYGPPLATAPFLVLAMLAFACVGALIMTRRPGHPIGWIYSASGLVMAIAMPAASYAAHVAFDPAAPFATLAVALNASAFFDGFLVPLTFGLLLFPDGRLPSARWWPLAILVVAVLLAFAVGPAIDSVQGNVGELPPSLVVAAVIGVVGVAASLVVRWRRAWKVERAQLKWVGSASAAFAIVLVELLVVQQFAPESPLGVSNSLGIALGSFSFLLIPISIGVAILRYRLYDIDLLINRTVVYGATSGLIGAGFFIGVVVLQSVVRPLTGGSEIAVAASTLGCFALFQPVRKRIQSTVDRRFYRSRHDAVRTLDEFSTRLRDEVDLDAVRADLLDAVAATVQPTAASLWIR